MKSKQLMQICLALPVSDSSPFHVVLLLPLRRVCMTKEESGRQLLKRNFIHAEGDQRHDLLLMETWDIQSIVTKNFPSSQVIREILQQFFIQAVQAEIHDDNDKSTTTNQSSIIISSKSSSYYQTI